MADILTFERASGRSTRRRSGETGPAAVIMFPGVRYERLEPETGDRRAKGKSNGARSSRRKGASSPEY